MNQLSSSVFKPRELAVSGGCDGRSYECGWFINPDSGFDLSDGCSTGCEPFVGGLLGEYPEAPEREGDDAAT
jgi:hypothetical protein